MCSNESLLLSLEGIKNGVCDVESRMSEFADDLLAAFLNGAGTASEVENEMTKLTEAIGQLKEIIQTIEANIRQNADEDNVPNYIKLEVEFFEDEQDELADPDEKHSIESENCSGVGGNMVIVSARSLETENKELKNAYSHEGEKEESDDDTGRSYKRSRTRKTCSSKCVRKSGIKMRKSKPKTSSTLMDHTSGETFHFIPHNTLNDIKLKQLVEVSVTRLNENELHSSDPNTFTGEIQGKRAAAVKALSNFRKRKSSDSGSCSLDESLDAKAEESDSKSDLDFEPDEKTPEDSRKCFPYVSQTRRSKLEKTKIVSKSVKSPCPKCGVMLVPGRMKIHVKLHEDPTVFNFVCTICSVRFVSESHFRTHQLSHEQAFRCPHCDKKYCTQAGLIDHVKENHSTLTSDTAKPVAVNQNCQWCLKDKLYKNKNMFAIHESRCLRILGNPENSAEGPWKCSKDECSLRTPFSNFLEFKIHMRSGVHPSPSDQDCVVQETHERSEGEKEMFNCPKCDESHGAKSFLNHVQFCLCGGHQSTTVKCPLPLCNIEFTVIKSLVEHLKRHQRKERSPNISSLFQCSKCEKRFAYEITYERHLRVVHSTDRPFSCNKCPFTCRWKESLNKHLRTIHPSQENPLWQRVICDQCGHTFADKNCLDRHVKQVHLDVRPYNCTLCDKRFKVRSHLNYHLKTHDNPNGRKRSLNKPRRKPVYRTGPPLGIGKKKLVTDDIADLPVPSATENSVKSSVLDVLPKETYAS